MGKSRKLRRFGRSLLDLLLLAAIVYGGWGVAQSALSSADRDADIRVVLMEARAVYEAFEKYRERNGEYPGTYTEPRFDPVTLDPFRKRGYYDGFLTIKLRGQQVDAYDSPDDRGINQEFWAELTLGDDPSIRFLIAKSDDAPMGGGKWREGVFIWRRGVLEPV